MPIGCSFNMFWLGAYMAYVHVKKININELQWVIEI
jgi:hypothetical protein